MRVVNQKLMIFYVFKHAGLWILLNSERYLVLKSLVPAALAEQPATAQSGDSREVVALGRRPL